MEPTTTTTTTTSTSPPNSPVNPPLYIDLSRTQTPFSPIAESSQETLITIPDPLHTHTFTQFPSLEDTEDLEPDEPPPEYRQHEDLEAGPRYTVCDCIRGRKMIAQELVSGRRSRQGFKEHMKFSMFVLLILIMLGALVCGVLALEGIAGKGNPGRKHHKG
ncbi:hypothetical protein BJX70DRAFT_401530 [Aspergillus crustosus]